MKNRNIMNIATTILFGLACLAPSPKAQAIVPAPDGGYPGGNTAEGQNALFSLTTGGYNTGNGWNSLHTLSSGGFNTGIGAATLFANTGINNTATGAAALLSNTTAGDNTANGAFALINNTDGGDNTATGFQALRANISGGSNTAIGAQALINNTIGGFNTAIGSGALYINTTGSGNTVLGAQAGSGITTANNVICIGADGNNVNDSCFIGNIFGQTSPSGVAVFVNSNGRLGTMTSSARFKDDIKPMEQASGKLYALKPVTFHYRKDVDPHGTSQFGLVAEDVEKVNHDLVVCDKEGKPYSVRYDQVNAMLLNEFLKEHRTVQELKSEIAALNATVKEQAAQIQKVSAQLNMQQPALQTVAKNSIE